MVAIYIYSPGAGNSCCVSSSGLVHSIYRLDCKGVDAQVPESGGVPIVCNHVSFVDALVIAAAFAGGRSGFAGPQRVPQADSSASFSGNRRQSPSPAAKEDPEMMERARRGRSRLAAGEVVESSRRDGGPDGEIHEFRPGVSRILERCQAPVVPCPAGLWGVSFPVEECHETAFRRGIFSRIAWWRGPDPAGEVTPARLQAAVVARGEQR